MPLDGDYEPSPNPRARNQVELYEGSGGTKGTTMRGMPVVVLTTKGAKSGRLRKTPLMRVEHDGKYAVVASLGGAPKHPVWYYNVKEHPEVELQDGAVKKTYRAEVVEGDERADLWKLSVDTWPTYGEYQKKTDRQIPVFKLTPID